MHSSKLPTITKVVGFDDRDDGVTVYHIQLSDGKVIDRRYNEILNMYENLPNAKRDIAFTFPSKTGLRKANLEQKQARVVAFDKILKLISEDDKFNSHEAYKEFVVGKHLSKLEKKIIKKFKKMEWKEFKVTDIVSFDEFFDSAAEPINSIIDLGSQVSDAHETLSGLFSEDFVRKSGVDEGDMVALIRCYLKEIKKAGGKVKLKLSDEGVPYLKIKGKHAEHVESFVTAIQSLVDTITELLQKSPEILSKIEDLASTCSEFPGKIKDEAGDLNPLKLGVALKNTTSNIKYLGGVPGEFEEVVNNTQEFIELLKKCIEETMESVDDL